MGLYAVNDARTPAPCADGRQSSSTYIATLDGWRAIAILGVIFHHATLPLIASHPWLSFGDHGAAGVDVFFALSGFLICSRLLLEQRQSGRISLGAFYARRAFRILPPYVTYLGTLALMSVAGLGSLHLYDWLSCLTFTRNYLQDPFWSWKTGHFWSLSVEEHFYLLFPAALVAMGWQRMRRWLPVFLVAATVWRLLDFRFHWFDRLVLSQVPYPYRSDLRLDGIALGCLGALLIATPEIREAIRSRINAGVLVGLAVALLVVTLVPVPMGALWQRLLITACVLGTVLRPEAWAARWLEMSWLRWVGRLSYSLYIWQQLFFTPTLTGPGSHYLKVLVGWFGITGTPDQLRILQLPLLLGASVLMACLSYYVVEQPVMRLGRRLMSGDRPKAAVAATLLALEPQGKTA